MGFLKEVLLNVPSLDTTSPSSSLGRAACGCGLSLPGLWGHLKLSQAQHTQGHGVPSSCDPTSWGTQRLASCPPIKVS